MRSHARRHSSSLALDVLPLPCPKSDMASGRGQSRTGRSFEEDRHRTKIRRRTQKGNVTLRPRVQPTAANLAGNLPTVPIRLPGQALADIKAAVRGHFAPLRQEAVLLLLLLRLATIKSSLDRLVNYQIYD